MSDKKMKIVLKSGDGEVVLWEPTWIQLEHGETLDSVAADDIFDCVVNTIADAMSSNEGRLRIRESILKLMNVR